MSKRISQHRNSVSEIETLQAQLAELQAQLEKLTRIPATTTPVLKGITRKGNWLWLKFTDKPSEKDRVVMKAAGGKYSRRRGMWYIPCRTDREATKIEKAIARKGLEALKAFPVREGREGERK